jgi:predicted DNA binding CopG/RHH family protein
MFPNLKPNTESISLRLSVSMLEGLKIEANKPDVPYQSLLKMWLADKLGEVSKGSARDGENS